MLKVKIIGYTGRLLLAMVLVLATLGFSPATAKAATNPIDLVLGGEGATSWKFSNIKPTDSGTKTVELHNAGSKDGFITIWVSDIISSEGINPESETGNTTEPGELADHLLLSLAADGLNTNVNLPAAINNLPQSFAGSKYIEIIPLKAGVTINLQWKWDLPAKTGNEVQGDTMSFTLNYLLRECAITDVSEVVTKEGTFTKQVTAESEGSQGKVTIAENTTGRTKEGEALTEIWIIETDKEPPAPPENKTVIGLNYELGPDGATFDQPITITFSYNPDDIPPGVNEGELVLALWDKNTSQWVLLDNCTVNTADNTISGRVSHFSRYTIISPLSPPPPPYIPEPPEPVREVGEVEKEKEPAPTPRALLEITMLNQETIVEIGDDGTLDKALTLTDSKGNFIIDIAQGTRLTGAGDAALSRIEIKTTDQAVVVPDNIVVISPLYQVTGYDRNMAVTQINFYPPARLTIRYNQKDLPENAFLPFVAKYTDEQGLERLEPPPDSLVEIGRSKALVSQASLFVVAVELAPPPPPLPARFEASNLVINPREAYPGETVTISITISNEGAVTGTYELHLIIDGIVRAVEEVTLTGKSSETLTFEVSNLAVGTHLVKVAGLTGRFKIVSVAVPPGEPEFNWLVLDIAVGGALLLGAIVLFLMIRRSRRATSAV